MIFISVQDGYVNVNYIKKFTVADKKIVIHDSDCEVHFIDKKFDSDEDALSYLSDLIEDLSKLSKFEIF